MAVAIHVARVRGSERPASDVVDGLANMLAVRNPSLTWEPRQSNRGDVFYLPRQHKLAAKHANIFDRFVGG